MTPPEYMTKDEVAEYLQVRPWTIDRLRADEGLPCVPLSQKTLRYRKVDIDRWATERASNV